MPHFLKKYSRFLLPLLIIIITAFSFSPALNNELTNWDDETYITQNQLIRSLDLNHLKAIFTAPISSNYHPLTILSLGVNYQVHGVEARGYILTNIVLHLLNTLLVFVFVYLISQRNVLIAFVTALLFGIHPMHVESVAWVSERKDVLYAFFALGGFITYWSYIQSSKKMWWAATFLLFVASVLSKSAAVVFPVLLLVLDYWAGQKWQVKLILEKLPFFIVALVFGIIAIQTQSEKAIGDYDHWHIGYRLLFACYGLVMYMVKLLIPIDLSAFYPYPKIGDSLPIIFYVAPVLVAAFATLVVWSAKWSKVLAFGTLFFLASIALVLQVLPVGEAIMADRYTYLPYIGLFWVIAYGFDFFKKNILSKMPQPNGLPNKQQAGNTSSTSPFPKKLFFFLQKKPVAYTVFGLGMLYTVFLSYTTHERTKVWQNSGTLWTDVIEQFPDRIAVAYNNRGNYYRHNQQLEKAMSDYNKALSINPLYYRAYGNRGNLYITQGKLQKALKDCNKVIELAPDSEDAYSNRGAIYSQLQDYDQAMRDYNKALELNPNHTNTYGSRAALQHHLGNYAAAIPDFERFLAVNPTNAQMHYLRGNALHQLQQYQKAIVSYSKAIQLQPQNGQFYLHRAYAFAALQKNGKAKKDVEQAQSLGVTVDGAFLEGL